MTNSRVNLKDKAPVMVNKLLEMEEEFSNLASETNLSVGFLHLLKLRASQINKCAFCIRMHAQDALKSGETVERIGLISAWEEADYFTLKEKACLVLVEAITMISEGQVPQKVYDEAKKNLSDDEILVIEWLGILINSWNRLAVASRFIVKA